MLVASLGWGTAGVATRAALDQGVPPYGLALFRAGIAAVAVILFLVVGRRGVSRSPEAWKTGLVMGTTNLAAPFILSNIALQYASAGFLGIMTALIPIMTAGVAHLMLDDERLTTIKFLGLTIGFSGVAVLFLSGDSGLAEGGRPLLAGVLGLIAVLSIAFGGTYAKKFAGRYEPSEVSGIHFTSGAVVIGIAMLLIEGAPGAQTGEAWALMSYMALASTFLPFMLFYWMLRHVSATYASMVGYIVPVIAVTAGVVFLDEKVEAGIALGGLLILIGVVITDRVEARYARARAGIAE
jgi:drug/metabolite transporter (DMT)-like permease